MAESVRELIARIVIDGEKDFKDAMSQVNEQAKETQKNFDNLKKVTTPLGLALAGAAGFGLKMVDSSLKMNASLAQTAITVGSTTSEMRELALSTTNVTFGLQSVIDTLEILARAGVRGTENLQASANAFDALADATSYTAEAVAEMLIPAFKNMGVAIPQTSAELDAFTWLVKNTMVNLEDFAAAMDYAAVYGGDLNLTIEEMVAIMAALEDKGITGSAVTRLFRTAVTQAATGAVTLAEALNLTQGEIDAFKGTLSSATGITDKYAEAANKQYGIMDKLKQSWAELQLRIGTFLEPMQGMLIGMLAVGSALVALPMIIPKVITAIRALSVAMRILSTAGGVLGVVGVVAALGIGLYDLIRKGKDWTESVNNWTDALDSANERLARLEEQGRGASEEADTLRLMIDDLTESLEKYSEVGDDNAVTAYNLADAMDKLTDATQEYYGLKAFEKGDFSALENMSWKEQIYALGQYEAATADAADTTLDLLNGIEQQIKSMDDLSEAYTDAAGNAEILSMIEAELNSRMQETAQTTYDDAIKALEDYYGIQEEESKSLLEIYSDEVDAQKDALNQQLKDVRDSIRDELDEYNDAYNEKVRLFDEETDARVKALQDQLDALNDTQDEISRQREDEDDAKTEAELRAAVDAAWNRKDRAKAEEDLAKFLEERSRKLEDRELDDQRDALSDQIKEVQDSANDQKRLWEQEYNNFNQVKNAELRSAESTIQAELDSLENAVDDYQIILQKKYNWAVKNQEKIRDSAIANIKAEVQAQLNAWSALASATPSFNAPFNISTGTAGAGLGLGASVRGYAHGGPIIEDTLLVGMKSGVYAKAHAGETVTPKGGGNVTINVNGGVYSQDSDRKALAKEIGRELYRQRQMNGNYGS